MENRSSCSVSTSRSVRTDALPPGAALFPFAADAGFWANSYIECTGVLIECGFLSNYEEAKRLQTDAYQKKLSAAICGAITEYLSEREERHEI